MNEIRVSVVMPTYNGGKYLRQSIESILNQTYTHFEFIIVDDGSTDNSVEIIHSFADPRIKYIYQAHMGPASAYNTGFKITTTDYVFIMDHDDISFADRLEKQMKFMTEHELDVCGSNYEILHEQNGYIEKIVRNFSDEELKEKLLYLPWAMLNPTICVKRNILEEYNYYDENYEVSFDYEFVSRIMFHAKLGIVPDCLYRWTQHASSYSSKTSKKARTVFKSIALKKIKGRKEFLTLQKYYAFIGLLYYYSDRMLLACTFLFVSFFFGMKKITLKYFFAILFGGLVVKIVRRYELFSNVFVRTCKKLFLEV